MIATLSLSSPHHSIPDAVHASVFDHSRGRYLRPMVNWRTASKRGYRAITFVLSPGVLYEALEPISYSRGVTRWLMVRDGAVVRISKMEAMEWLREQHPSAPSR